MALAMLGISVPNFVLGPILVLIFSLTLYWLPPSRWGGFPSRNLVLPVLTLSALYMAYIARLTRAGMLEVLRSDYIRTARAKGLSEKDVVIRACFAWRSDAGDLLHWTSAGVSVDRHGGGGKVFRFAGSGKLLHPGISESRRAVDYRNRRFYCDHTLVDESAG